MVSGFMNHKVILGMIFVGQARLKSRHGTQARNLLVFLVIGVLCIATNEENVHERAPPFSRFSFRVLGCQFPMHFQTSIESNLPESHHFLPRLSLSFLVLSIYNSPVELPYFGTD